MDFNRNGDMDCGRKSIVGALSHVDVIVRMNRFVACKAISAGYFDGTITDNLIGVHVAAGSRTGLEHVDREFRIPLASSNLKAGL